MSQVRAVTGLLLMVVAGCAPAVSGSRPGEEADSPPVRAKAVSPKTTEQARRKTRDARPEPRSFASIGEAIGVLTEAAEARDSQGRLQASDWLALQGAAAIPPLNAVLEDEQAGTAARIAVCRVLGRLGPPALAALRGQLHSDDQFVRINALSQLPHLEPVTPEVLTALIGALDHEDIRMRARAIQGLGSLGPKAESAAPRLQAILNSREQDQLRSEAKKALQQVDPRRTLTFD